MEKALRAYSQELKEARVVRAKPWTIPTAKAAIAKFLRKRPSAYVSEIAEVLGMDFETAFAAVDSLVEEGQVDRAA